MKINLSKFDKIVMSILFKWDMENERKKDLYVFSSFKFVIKKYGDIWHYGK